MAGRKVAHNQDYFLWERFRKGDRQALSEIYHKCYSPLYHYGLRIVNRPAFIKDNIQELFIDLVNGLSGLGPTDNIRIYLWVSFRRKILHKLKNNQTFSYSDHEDVVFNDHLDDSHEDRLILSEEQANNTHKIREAMKNLGSREREAIYLKFYRNMTHGEIAEILEVRVASVSKLIYRAMNTLRDSYKREFY